MKRDCLALIEMDEKDINKGVINSLKYKGIDCWYAFVTDGNTDHSRKAYMTYLIKFVFTDCDEKDTSPMTYEQFKECIR